MTKRSARKARQVRQDQVFAWGRETFGDLSMCVWERARRFLEEAIELAQAAGVSPNEAAAVMDRAYRRPPGLIHTELGQAGLTLEMFAASVGMNAEEKTAAEFERVLSIPADEWRARLAKKVAEGIAQ
jgi:hypothetical protein